MEQATDRADLWRAVRLWAVVLCFAGVAVFRSFQVGVPFRDPHGDWALRRLRVTAEVTAVLVVLDAVLRAGRPWRLGGVLTALRARWTWGRAALVASALLAYHATYFCYHNLKSWAVFNRPRDQMLLSVDRWLFAGHSPAVLLHQLLGEHVAALVLSEWYETFPPLTVLAFPAAVLLARRVSDAYAGIAAFVWVWILGTASYYVIPTLGPFWSAPQEFRGLTHTVVQDSQAKYLAGRAFLLAHPQAHDAGAQVAAFASLHVGVSAVVLGLAWWHRRRVLTVLLSVFLAGTIVATVYLGWHFVVDIPAGLLIAALSWWLGPLTVGVRRRPRPRR